MSLNIYRHSGFMSIIMKKETRIIVITLDKKGNNAPPQVIPPMSLSLFKFCYYPLYMGVNDLGLSFMFFYIIVTIKAILL